jgi:hypothetical protein
MDTLKPIPGAAILRNTYLRPEDLRETAQWARAKLAGELSIWERQYLTDEIARIESALAAVPAFVDVGTISEYGLTQKLSQAVRCF